MLRQAYSASPPPPPPHLSTDKSHKTASRSNACGDRHRANANVSRYSLMEARRTSLQSFLVTPSEGGLQDAIGAMNRARPKRVLENVPEDDEAGA